MRLSDQQIKTIKSVTQELTPPPVSVKLFGSRLDNNQRGGDVDLLLEFEEALEHPAMMAAQVAARISRRLNGRKVDVLVKAPNLEILPVHQLAEQKGQWL